MSSACMVISPQSILGHIEGDQQGTEGGIYGLGPRSEFFFLGRVRPSLGAVASLGGLPGTASTDCGVPATV